MKKTALFLVSIILLSVFFGSIILINNDSSSSSNNKDSDGDGAPDNKDDFPDDPAASIDSDNDGYPDDWNIGKKQDDSIKNLIIDAFPDDPAASIDSDNDGYPDCWNRGKDQGDSTSIPPLELDEFPNDPKIHKDTDKDGVPDYYDINDYVNLSITIKLEKFKVIDRVDLLRWAQVYFDIYINSDKPKRVDNSGKRWIVLLNQEKKINHDSITYDITDNTTKPFTDIEIIMYDYDFIGKDDVIDISDKSSEKTLILKFNNVDNTISHDDITEGDKGILWYNITFAKSEFQKPETYKRTYRWNFNNKPWEISIEIPVDLYEAYLESNTKRSPKTNDEMARFVTSNNNLINDFANELISLIENENYDSVTIVNFILRFIQRDIKYIFDNESKGKIEYWRFPVETLVEQEGDCEDTSVLFSAIMDALGYDTVLLLYNLKQDDQKLGHLAVGIHLEGDHGSYVKDYTGKKYYYCETTTISYIVGQLPPDIEDKPNKIIHIK